MGARSHSPIHTELTLWVWCSAYHFYSYTFLLWTRFNHFIINFFAFPFTNSSKFAVLCFFNACFPHITDGLLLRYANESITFPSPLQEWNHTCSFGSGNFDFINLFFGYCSEKFQLFRHFHLQFGNVYEFPYIRSDIIFRCHYMEHISKQKLCKSTYNRVLYIQWMRREQNKRK